MATAKAKLIVKSFAGRDSLAAMMLDGDYAGAWFWLSGVDGASRAIWREGSNVQVKFDPADQFCSEVTQ